MGMEGKTVVITGATSGIGEVAAVRLAQRGARIVFTARDKIRADDTMAKLRAASPDADHAVYMAELSSIAEMKRVGTELAALPQIDVRGLMTVAPHVDDAELVRPVFRGLRELAEANGLRELSMGMTNDYEVAIEEGATFVRVGRAIFGERA